MTSTQELQELLEQGEELLKSEEYTEALAIFDQALQIEPNSVKAIDCKAFCLNNLERYQESLEIIEKAIQLEPDYYAIWGTKGEILEYGFERYEEALSCYEKAIELDSPQQGKAKGWLLKSSPLYELGRYQESIAAVNKALELNLSSSFVSDAVYLQADCYASLKEDGLALTYLKKSVELNKNCKNWAKEDPDFSHLYSDQRFQAIVDTTLTPESVKKIFDDACKNSDGDRFFAYELGTRIDKNDLPNNVKEAYNFYKIHVEDADFGGVAVHQISVDAVPVYAVIVVTDGDDGYLEIYSQTGEEIACGKNNDEEITWSDKATTRTDLG